MVPEALFELNCGHVFHEFCIRGWCLIGKKDTCPICSEKVDIKSVVGNTPWEAHAIMWGNLLDAVRYLVVWNPVILILLQTILHVVGY